MATNAAKTESAGAWFRQLAAGWHVAGWLAVCMLAGVWPAGPALAQSEHRAAVIVGGDVITAYDVQQRARLLAISTRKPLNEALRNRALESLIDDLLMQQEAERLGVSVSEEEVQEQVEAFAKRNKMSVKQFGQVLGQRRIDLATFSASIRTQLLARKLWPEVVRKTYPRQSQIRQEEIDRELEKLGGAKVATRYEFESQNILFLFRKDASKQYVAQRKSDAERIRRSLQSCQNSRALVAGMRDVVVKDLGLQTSDDLAPQVVKDLERIDQFGTLPVQSIDAGYVVVVVCSKKKIEDDQLARRQAQVKLTNQKFSDLARRHLDDLRRDTRMEGDIPPRYR